MSVSADTVRAIAALARLHVDESRIGSVAEELSGILEHMEDLQRVDGVERPFVETKSMPLRDDVVAPIPLATTLDAFAPLMRHGFFLVPRLNTHGSPETDLP